ncbi:MAG: 3-phosphoshikimate 1-carboxyvinyltransferase [Planctomycetota bacterium]|jgi:3-phosphoshikimate 1-carboxyvinyltransferase
MNAYRCQTPRIELDATVRLPGSKSITNRALLAAAMAHGRSVLHHALLAEDTELMIGGLRRLGVAVEVDEIGTTLTVQGCAGHLNSTQAALDCGNSGTTIRFLTALVATSAGRFELDGIARMRQRPIGALCEVLEALGAGIEYGGNVGYPPVVVHANGLSGGHVSFRNPPSSQLVTGLLLAAPMAARDVLIDLHGDVLSRPYLEMTEAVMDAFGVAVMSQFDKHGAKFIVAAPQHYQACDFAIEPDASNATYFWAAAAIAGGSVTVQDLGMQSIQGDLGFADVLVQMGCVTNQEPMGTRVTGPADGNLRGIDVDLMGMPDTAQTLAVVALFASGRTVLRGLSTLRIKETDRLAALETELGKLGAVVETTDDTLIIDPPDELVPTSIETYQDHRMAMSFSLAGLRGTAVEVLNPTCCAKTFPEYFKTLDGMLGVG